MDFDSLIRKLNRSYVTAKVLQHVAEAHPKTRNTSELRVFTGASRRAVRNAVNDLEEYGAVEELDGIPEEAEGDRTPPKRARLTDEGKAFLDENPQFGREMGELPIDQQLAAMRREAEANRRKVDNALETLDTHRETLEMLEGNKDVLSALHQAEHSAKQAHSMLQQMESMLEEYPDPDELNEVVIVVKNMAARMQ